MLIFGKFFNTSKMLSRATKRFVPFIEKASMNPVVKFGEQKIKDVVGEGILEEAGINMIAQKKGEFYANGLYYSIDDYKKEIGNKDWTENFLRWCAYGCTTKYCYVCNIWRIKKQFKNL